MRILIVILSVVFFSGLLYQAEQVSAKAGESNRFTPGRIELHTGDIILRQGKGFISELFRISSMKDQQFSHAGIIQETANGFFVIHVLDESGSKESDLRVEAIGSFCDSNDNLSYAIFRYSFLSGKEPAINNYLEKLQLKNIQFDDQFNLTSDTALYCTELVYKMCLTVADYKLPITDFENRSYVGLDNLYQNNVSTLITMQTY